VAGIAFSPHDPKLLALAQGDGPVTLWDVSTRTRIGKPLAVTGGPENPVAFSADGGVLAAANRADDAVVLFDVGTHARAGRPLRPPYADIRPDRSLNNISGIAFSRDGRLLATGDQDGFIVLWDLAKHPPIFHPAPEVCCAAITSVAFSPDGRTLASAVEDGTVFLIHVPDSTVLHQLTATGGPPSSVPTAVAFSPPTATPSRPLAATARCGCGTPTRARPAARRGPRRAEGW